MKSRPPAMAAADHKYRVIKRLEAGGMAEVYLGEAISVQGFRKQVAIKRVLPHLAQNQSFIEMFLDEARLSAKLTHANIVSVFDISKREDTYFLIMEFVDGVNLKRVMETLLRRGLRVRLPEAIHICVEACRGLSYAHELTDESGTPLSIVHRDISPPNIMVTRRGEVKLADFGLAKASTQVQTTDPGVVKGKFSYLAPEAANGMAVDHKADIFALGIVLWEMLAGKRLFWGENDYATVKLIQKANIPRLSPLNREVDEAFEEVLMRALARDPKDRYQSAREFGDALSDYLFRNQLMVTAYDLANLVQTTMAEEPVGKAGELSLIDRLIQDELDESIGIGSQSGSIPKPAASPDMALAEGESYEDPASWFDDDNDVKTRSVAPRRAAKEPSRAWRESGIPPQPAPAAESSQSAREPEAPLEVEELQASELVVEDVSNPPSQAAAVAKPVAQKRNTMMYVAIALVVIAVLGAVGLWFSTRT